MLDGKSLNFPSTLDPMFIERFDLLVNQDMFYCSKLIMPIYVYHKAKLCETP